MPRLHTKVKRRLGLVTSRRHRFLNIKGKKGAKTFTTKEAADNYAKTILKVENYTIESAKRDKKFKIVY